MHTKHSEEMHAWLAEHAQPSNVKEALERIKNALNVPETAVVVLSGLRGAGETMVAGTLIDERRHQRYPAGPIGVIRRGGHWLSRVPDIDNAVAEALGMERKREHEGGEPLVVVDGKEWRSAEPWAFGAYGSRKRGERPAQVLVMDREGRGCWEQHPVMEVKVERCGISEMRRLWEIKYQSDVNLNEELSHADLTLLQAIGDGRAEDIAYGAEDVYWGWVPKDGQQMPFSYVLAKAFREGMEADLQEAEDRVRDRHTALRCLEWILWQAGETTSMQEVAAETRSMPDTVKQNMNEVVETGLVEIVEGGVRATSVRAVLAAARRRKGHISREMALQAEKMVLRRNEEQLAA